MEKRALLAVVLSIMVIFMFQMYTAKNQPQTVERPPSVAQMPQQHMTHDSRPMTQDSRPMTQSSPLPQEKEIETKIETDKFIITFTNIGGAIKKIELKDYPDSKTGEPFVLAETEGRGSDLCAISDLHAISGGDLRAIIMAQDGIQTTPDGKQITYSYGNQIMTIEKVYKLHNSLNHIELRVKLRNLDGMQMADYGMQMADYGRQITSSYKIIGGSGINKSEAMSARFVEANARINGKVLRDKKNSMRPGEVSWIALKNKYFSILLKPHQFGKLSFTERDEENNLLVGMETAQFTIPAGGEIAHDYLYYIGPNNIPLLKSYGMGLEEVVNYGIFGGISMVLLNVLRFFHKIFRNWGVAIICVTALMNTVLYPLTRKSYQSMKQMQELQPHMEELRKIHKDNPQKLNREMLELYRKYKVNPMGGCLPLFLQMPVIFAMYQTIMRSIELKGSNFLWIKDLSLPDAVPLPFALPLVGQSINILPIFMVVAMILQQKLSPLSKGRAQSEQQKQQQTMMLFMPIVFGFIFYTLPSGLVLYWVVNTVLMMVNQFRVMKATPALT